MRNPDQPHSWPFETATRTPTSPSVRPAAPTRSTRPPWPSRTRGTRVTTPAARTAARTAAVQNMACQSAAWAMYAESGSPMAPPTPRVALMAATAVLTSCGGVTSRISAMLTGMKPIARPWRARPTSMGVRESAKPHTSEPTTSSSALTTITRGFPKRSPSRPLMGMATAAASSVIVATQPALETDVPSRRGSSPWIGITIVCVSETVMPPKHSTPTVRTLRWSVRAVTMCTVHIAVGTWENS